MQQARRQDPASFEERTIRLSPTGEQDQGMPRTPLIGMVGHWSACNVYIRANQDWNAVPVMLEVQQGESTMMVDHVVYGDCARTRYPGNAPVVGEYAALALQARGRCATAFRAYALTGDVDRDLGTAYVRMECWSEEGASPGDMAGRSIVYPYARPEAHVWGGFTRTLAGAGTMIARPSTFLIAPEYRRVCLTQLSITTDDALVINRCQILNRPVVGPASVVAEYMVGANSPVHVTFPTPLWGFEDGQWEGNVVLAMTPGASFKFYSNGFYT